MDGCAEAETVARREVEEETGLTDLKLIDPVPFDLDIHPIPKFRGVSAHEHFDVRFAFRASGDLSLRLSDESHDVSWIPIDKLDDYDPDPSILRMRTKWLSLDLP